jgi:MFS family permease
VTPGETAGSPGGWLSGGLDRATLVVAGVATLGLIMAVLDTTIVNVALDTLSRDLHSSLTSIEWVSTGYLLSLAAVIRCQAGLLKASAPSGPGSCRSGCSRWDRVCARSRRAIGSRDGGLAHAEAGTH